MGQSARLGDFVEVGAFTLLADARAFQGLLEAEGLTVHLQGVDVVGTLPHMSNALGGVRVFVPAGDEERAREIMDADGGEPESEADAAALDGDEEAEGPRDAPARRAFFAAILGLIFLPGALHLVSLWHLATYARTPGEVSARARRRAIIAGVVDVAVLILAAVIVARMRR